MLFPEVVVVVVVVVGAVKIRRSSRMASPSLSLEPFCSIWLDCGTSLVPVQVLCSLAFFNSKMDPRAIISSSADDDLSFNVEEDVL